MASTVCPLSPSASRPLPTPKPIIHHMPNPNDPAIASGAQHVDETEQLAHGYEAPHDVSAAEINEEDSAPVQTHLAELTLSMFAQGSSTRVRVGNPNNSSELYEHAFDTPDEANAALLDAGILTPDQVVDPTALAGVHIPLQNVTVEQLESAGLKRHGASTL